MKAFTRKYYIMNIKDYQNNILSTPIWGFVLDSEKYHVYDYVELFEALKFNKKSWVSDDNLHKNPVMFELNKLLRNISSDIIKEYCENKSDIIQ